jgi:hypothetical protein
MYKVSCTVWYSVTHGEHMWSDTIGLIHSWLDSITGDTDMKIPTEHIPDNPPPNHKLQNPMKVDLAIVPVIAIAHEAVALMAGAKKHGRDNYRDSLVDANLYLAAALRHISLWQSGQDVDPEGFHHLGAARACLGMLLDAWENGNMVDNRVCNAYPDVLEQLNELVREDNEQYEITKSGEQALQELKDYIEDAT